MRSWQCRFLAFITCLVSALGYIALNPSRANADLMNISENTSLAIFNRNGNALISGNVNTINGYVKYEYDWSFGDGNPITLQLGSFSNNSGTSTFSSSTTGTVTSHGTIGGTSSSTYSGTSSGYDYGRITGEYDNPNSVLGDDLGIGGDWYGYTSNQYSGSVSTGYSQTTSDYGNTSTTGTGTGTSNGTSVANYYWEYKPNNGVDFTQFNTYSDYGVMFGFHEFGRQGTDTVLRVVGFNGGIQFVNLDDSIEYGYITDYRVYVKVGNTADGQMSRIYDNAGRFTVNSQQFDHVYVAAKLSGMQHKKYKSIRIPYTWRAYIDLDATYNQNTNSTITNTTEQQTNEIGQQTQNQTNQLKDTSGSDGILTGAQSAGNNIVNNLGFVAQTASFVTDSVSAITNTNASATVHFPGIKVQNNVIAQEQDVNILGWFPTELETTIRTFGTLLFTLAWINGLRRMYEKIFGGEKVVEVDTE